MADIDQEQHVDNSDDQDDQNDICCDIPLDEAEATPDEDLPVAVGGVE